MKPMASCCKSILATCVRQQKCMEAPNHTEVSTDASCKLRMHPPIVYKAACMDATCACNMQTRQRWQAQCYKKHAGKAKPAAFAGREVVYTAAGVHACDVLHCKPLCQLEMTSNMLRRCNPLSIQLAS